MNREVLYVGMTRGRESNHMYVCTDGAPEPLTGFADQENTARGVLTAVLSGPELVNLVETTRRWGCVGVLRGLDGGWWPVDPGPGG